LHFYDRILFCKIFCNLLNYNPEINPS
jgi:hypothetical protein